MMKAILYGGPRHGEVRLVDDNTYDIRADVVTGVIRNGRGEPLSNRYAYYSLVERMPHEGWLFQWCGTEINPEFREIRSSTARLRRAARMRSDERGPF